MRGVVVVEEGEEGYKAETASSPKFTAPLLDTPQTITVLKKELLEDQAAGSLAEALRNTPGITFTLGENGNTTCRRLHHDARLRYLRQHLPGRHP